MKNVASVFRKKARSAVKSVPREWPLPEQLMGIEVEVDPSRSAERTKLPENFEPYWIRERDGSLRCGYEFVLKAPFCGNPLSDAIAQLFSDDPIMDRTATGSTHIHIDMLESGTAVSVIPVLTMLMFILEPAVFASADPGREWCGYTNRLASAPDVLLGSVLNGDLDTDPSALVDVVAGHNASSIGRYYGLNLQALHKYGSIEFRYFPTATTAEELASWVRMVQLFKKAATELGTLQRVEQIVKDEEAYKYFIGTYFKEWADVFLAHVPQYVAMQSYHKARAVADSWRTREDVYFNPNAVTSNKVLAKFLKKSKTKQVDSDDPFPVHVVGIADSVPQATLGALLVAGRTIYIGCNVYDGANTNWQPIANTPSFIEVISHLQRGTLRQVHSNLVAMPISTAANLALPTVAVKQAAMRVIEQAIRAQGYGNVEPASPEELTIPTINEAATDSIGAYINLGVTAGTRTGRVTEARSNPAGGRQQPQSDSHARVVFDEVANTFRDYYTNPAGPETEVSPDSPPQQETNW